MIWSCIFGVRILAITGTHGRRKGVLWPWSSSRTTNRCCFKIECTISLELPTSPAMSISCFAYVSTRDELLTLGKSIGMIGAEGDDERLSINDL